MAEDFTTNMMRMICGTLYFSASMQASREMYGRSYFSLGVGERAAVAVFACVHPARLVRRAGEDARPD